MLVAFKSQVSISNAVCILFHFQCIVTYLTTFIALVMNLTHTADDYTCEVITDLL